jgi:hypothetical protein
MMCRRHFTGVRPLANSAAKPLCSMNSSMFVTSFGARPRRRWLIISTGLFMSFLFEPFFGVVDLEGGAVVTRHLTSRI